MEYDSLLMGRRTTLTNIFSQSLDCSRSCHCHSARSIPVSRLKILTPLMRFIHLSVDARLAEIAFDGLQMSGNIMDASDTKSTHRDRILVTVHFLFALVRFQWAATQRGEKESHPEELQKKDLVEPSLVIALI